MSATRRLAEYASQQRYDDIPTEVIAQAKRAIRDSIACLLGGAALPLGREMRHLFLTMAADGDATVAGSKRRVTAPMASLINGYLANLFDYDDTLGGIAHPGATVVAPALAMAEQGRATGKDFLAAVVVGYDVCARVTAATVPSFERSKQVRGLGPWQVFGAVTVAGRLLDLEAEAMARAFGLAAMNAPVPVWGKMYEERPLTSLKNNFGWASMAGVLGALYAAEGLDGHHEILDGETGFWAMAGSDRCDYDVLTANLGSHYSVGDISFKPYPSCRHTHSALDAVRLIMNDHPDRMDTVVRVALRSSSKIHCFADCEPKTFIDAQYSLPYLVAVLLRGVPPGYRWLDKSPWRDPSVLEMASNVSVGIDPDAEADLMRGYMRMTAQVHFADGESVESQVMYPRGDPRNPLSDDDLNEKFYSLVAPLLGDSRARELFDVIGNLESERNLDALCANLVGLAGLTAGAST
jgi:2-methylcitrate dehydratase PrpD